VDTEVDDSAERAAPPTSPNYIKSGVVAEGLL
jgi:hypothetical protein